MSNFETEYKWADDESYRTKDSEDIGFTEFPEWSNIRRKSNIEEVLAFFDKTKGSSAVLNQQRQQVESTNHECRNINYSHAVQRFKVAEKKRLAFKNGSMSKKVPPQVSFWKIWFLLTLFFMSWNTRFNFRE